VNRAHASTATLSEADRAQALERYQQLRPALEDGVPLAQVAQEHQIPLRTAQRWVAQYRTYGLSGLMRAARADRGQHRRIAPELQRLIEGLALQRPPPSVATIHRQIVPIARAHSWPIPSYTSVYGIIQQLDPALTTLAHHGPKVYRETFDLIHRREAEKPNEIWQADHTPLDVWLIGADGTPIRPWLTIIEDDYSRTIAGYYLLTQAPSVLHTALALRQAIWRKSEPHWHVCGIPQIFYTDHGSDFTSRHLEQVAADLKIELIFSTVDMPRGRGKIERLFETINQRFLCEVPGYTPPGVPPATPQLTLDVFESRLRTFLLERYQQRPHGETGLAPQARWEAGGFLPHLPESLEQLDLLLLTIARTRRVQQDGIRFQGLRYLDLNLAAYVGEDVTIRYDPRDIAEIRVYHGDTFICHAVCQELAGQTISLKEIIATRNRRRRQLREQLADRRAVVDLLLEAHAVEESPPPAPSEESLQPRLKRYINE
jgi:putative transposase